MVVGVVDSGRRILFLLAELRRRDVISPSAGTALTASVLPGKVVRTRKPDYVAPIVVLLSSDKLPAEANGQMFEAGCGWQARTRFQRSRGHNFALNSIATPEDVQSVWREIVDFSSGGTSNAEVASETRKLVMANVQAAASPKPRL